MAYTRKRQRKDGSFFYEIAVSRGRGQTPYTMRWNMPEGLTTKTINKQLAIVAAQFEKDCRDGKVKTRKEAKADAEQAAQAKLDEEQKNMTFQQFCEQRFMPAIKGRCSKTTAYNYELQFKNHVYPVIGAIQLTELKAGDINQLLRKILAENDSDSLAIKVYTMIRSAVTMAYKDDLIEKDLMVKVDRPHKKKQEEEDKGAKACTAEQIMLLCEQLKQEPFIWQVIVRLLIDTGMRVGECVGLLWKNVDFDKNTILIDGALKYTPDSGTSRSTTKTGKSRTIGVDPEVMEMLKVLKQQQLLSTESEYVFVNDKTGSPIHPDSTRRFLNRIGEKCGIVGLHPHLLRHSFASLAITNGADIASVSEKLGHSDKAVTLRMYTHADSASIDKASEIFRQAIKPQETKSEKGGKTNE